MKKLILLLSWVLILALGVVHLKAQEVLVLQGSTTVLPIAQKAAEVFKRLHPEASLTVRGGGSGVGIAGLLDGTCDIAMSSRKIKDSELKIAESKGIKVKEFIIALDAVAVIVHPSNPIGNLTLSDLKRIYTGEVTNWKELKGFNSKIVVVSRDSASGTFECFNHLVLGEAPLTPQALYQASNKGVVTVVATTKGAIGYVGLAYLEPRVKAVAIEDVFPSIESARSGRYPLKRELYFYTRSEAKGLAKAFIDFVLSKDGQHLIQEVGYVPVK